VGNSFHGIFCANNTPDPNSFPSSVAYQRNADFVAHTLINVDLQTPIPISIDPFFFTVSDAADNIIAGFVLDPNGNPLVDATIIVHASDGTLVVQLGVTIAPRFFRRAFMMSRRRSLALCRPMLM
jgi:hypothetical protein